MSFLHNLKIWQKLSLIVAALCIPIVLLSGFLIRHLNVDIAIAQQEIDGITYLQPVRALLQHIAEHRGISQTVLTGDSTFKEKMLAKQDQIAQDIVALQAMNAQYGAHLNSIGLWNDIHATWEAIKAEGARLTAQENLKWHTALLKKLVDFNAHILIASGLILDPEQDSYFLIDTSIGRLISCLEDTGQLRALSTGITGRFRITNDEQVTLAKLMARSNIMREGIELGLTQALTNNKTLAAALQPKQAEFAQNTRAFVHLVDLHVMTGFFREQTLTAAEVFTTATKAIQSGFALYDAIIPVLQGLLDQRLKALEEEKLGTLSMVSVSVLFALGLAFLFIRLILKALYRAEAMAAAIAEGELHQGKTLLQHSTDEVGRLLHSLSATQDELIQVLSRIKQASEIVGTSAYEISQGAEDLAARTEKQASALEETAASMEQITATVRQSASNASYADELAHRAKAQAEKGGIIVDKAVIAMGEIHQSSYQIAKAISLIDEIAFRTNLLALNAAVEAAIAGDSGRGFAVVASEVRQLAQRSAAAAKEIKMTIEDSVEKVESGGALIEQAGQTLKDIVIAVTSVSDVIADITVASREQSAGIEQVNRAITQMDHVTQQNAALVEEASTACQSLRDQATELQSLLAFFKLDDER